MKVKYTEGKNQLVISDRDSFPSIFSPFSSYQYYFIFPTFHEFILCDFFPRSFSVWLLITLSAFSNAI